MAVIVEDIKVEDAKVVATRKYPIPSPTILFLKPGHLDSLVSGIISSAKDSWFLYKFAWRHKVAGVADGFITNQSLWDRLVFDGARVKVLGNGAATVRAVIVSGGTFVAFPSGFGRSLLMSILYIGPLDSEILTPARIALSVPFINAFTHPLVAAPVLASHPLDLQDFPSQAVGKSSGRTFAHTGPPGVNVEVKLVGVNDDLVENGGDPAGEVLVRGPPVCKKVNLEDYVHIPEPTSEEGWTTTDVKARVQTNGSFQLYV